MKVDSWPAGQFAIDRLLESLARDFWFRDAVCFDSSVMSFFNDNIGEVIDKQDNAALEFLCNYVITAHKKRRGK